MTFAIVARTPPYETLGFTELVRRTDGNISAIQSALVSGNLPAHVLPKGEGHFYRVPIEHWSQNESFIEGEVGETLFCWSDSGAPVKFHDLPLLFFRDEVEEWEAGEKARSYTQNGFSSEHATFEDCFSSAERPQEGQWTFFVTLAWIATRDDKFTAAAQAYCTRVYADRGGPHSAAAYMFLDKQASRRSPAKGFLDAQGELRRCLETGSLTGGKGKPIAGTFRQEPDSGDWADFRPVYDIHGISLLPGLYDFRWPSIRLRETFPAPATAVSTIESSSLLPGRRPTAQQQELFRFLDLAANSGFVKGVGDRQAGSSDREKTLEKLFECYEEQFLADRGRPRLMGNPFKFSRFKEMVVKFRTGARIRNGRWCEKTD